MYGSTEVDALDLRDLFGDHGLLRFDIVSGSQKPYMPFEKDSAMDCRRNFSVANPIRCFLSGDVRANEQVRSRAVLCPNCPSDSVGTDRHAHSVVP